MRQTAADVVGYPTCLCYASVAVPFIAYCVACLRSVCDVLTWQQLLSEYGEQMPEEDIEQLIAYVSLPTRRVCVAKGIRCECATALR